MPREVEGIVRSAMGPSGVEVLLYDLGNVILPFQHYQIAERLAAFSQKSAFQDPRKIFSRLFDFETGMINRYEEGRVSSLQFFLSLKESFDLSLSFEDFVPLWNDIFIENPEVAEMILSQRGRWRLGLLSNTNLLHFHHILATFPIVRAFDRWILSHEVGCKKPAVEIFRRAMAWAGVAPGKILFIDDMEKNVDVALSLGIQAIHFISATQLKEELSRALPC